LLPFMVHPVTADAVRGMIAFRCLARLRSAGGPPAIKRRLECWQSVVRDQAVSDASTVKRRAGFVLAEGAVVRQAANLERGVIQFRVAAAARLLCELTTLVFQGRASVLVSAVIGLHSAVGTR